MNPTLTLLVALLLAPLAVLTAADKPKAVPQAPKKQDRPTPPTRAFDAPGAPAFVRLDTKTSLADGNYLVGPTYVAAAETKAIDGVPQGKIQQFQIDSKTTQRFNPGIARDEFGVPDPNNPKTLIIKNLIGKNPQREQYRTEVTRMKGLLVEWLIRVKSPHLESVRARPILADANSVGGKAETSGQPKAKKKAAK